MHHLKNGLHVERIETPEGPKIRFVLKALFETGTVLCEISLREWATAVANTAARGESLTYQTILDALTEPLLPKWRPGDAGA